MATEYAILLKKDMGSGRHDTGVLRRSRLKCMMEKQQ
jgi:hypothetical protein